MTSRFLVVLAVGAALVPSTAAAQAGPPLKTPARPAADLTPLRDSTPPPPDDPFDTCRLAPDGAPDFTLEDVNPTSPTAGEQVPRTEPGDVTLLYIALASCGVCQADTDALGAIVADQGDAWSELSVRVLALDTALDSLPDLADGHDLPIVVDNETLRLADQYGAERWYIYLLDRSGQPAMIHYDLDFTVERDRLVNEVNMLLAGEALP